MTSIFDRAIRLNLGNATDGLKLVVEDQPVAVNIDEYYAKTIQRQARPGPGGEAGRVSVFPSIDGARIIGDLAAGRLPSTFSILVGAHVDRDTTQRTPLITEFMARDASNHVTVQFAANYAGQRFPADRVLMVNHSGRAGAMPAQMKVKGGDMIVITHCGTEVAGTVVLRIDATGHDRVAAYVTIAKRNGHHSANPADAGFWVNVSPVAFRLRKAGEDEQLEFGGDENEYSHLLDLATEVSRHQGPPPARPIWVDITGPILQGKYAPDMGNIATIEAALDQASAYPKLTRPLAVDVMVMSVGATLDGVATEVGQMFLDARQAQFAAAKGDGVTDESRKIIKAPQLVKLQVAVSRHLDRSTAEALMEMHQLRMQLPHVFSETGAKLAEIAHDADGNSISTTVAPEDRVRDGTTGFIHFRAVIETAEPVMGVDGHLMTAPKGTVLYGVQALSGKSAEELKAEIIACLQCFSPSWAFGINHQLVGTKAVGVLANSGEYTTVASVALQDRK